MGQGPFSAYRYWEPDFWCSMGWGSLVAFWGCGIGQVFLQGGRTRFKCLVPSLIETCRTDYFGAGCNLAFGHLLAAVGSRKKHAFEHCFCSGFGGTDSWLFCGIGVLLPTHLTMDFGAQGQVYADSASADCVWDDHLAGFQHGLWLCGKGLRPGRMECSNQQSLVNNGARSAGHRERSEEHTSELQSRPHL